MQRRSSEQDTDAQESLNSFYNSSTLYLNILSTNSTSDFVNCLFYEPNSLIFITFCIINIFLLLPLCIFILRHGFQKWLQNPSSSSAPAVRHSDCFTHHLAVLELNGVCGCFICVFAISSNCQTIASFGFSVYSFTCVGETFFHLLMCLEHYLAVVYPITYMGLRNKKGVHIRNICIFCTWLLCFTVGGLMQRPSVAGLLSFFLSVISIIINLFCCLSVLCVLIHPGPGKQRGDMNRREQLKYRAFYTILALLGVLVVRFSTGFIWVLQTITDGSKCLVLTCNPWFNLLSSLVQPLLFLQRAWGCVCPRIKNK